MRAEKTGISVLAPGKLMACFEVSVSSLLIGVAAAFDVGIPPVPTVGLLSFSLALTALGD